MDMWGFIILSCLLCLCLKFSIMKSLKKERLISESFYLIIKGQTSIIPIKIGNHLNIAISH